MVNQFVFFFLPGWPFITYPSSIPIIVFFPSRRPGFLFSQFNALPLFFESAFLTVMPPSDSPAHRFLTTLPSATLNDFQHLTSVAKHSCFLQPSDCPYSTSDGILPDAQRSPLLRARAS